MPANYLIIMVILGLDATPIVKFSALDYKFSDRFHGTVNSCSPAVSVNIFSMQIGLAYSHFNKIDTNFNQRCGIHFFLGRLKVTPQSSLMLALNNQSSVNYDPAFIVRYPNHWLTVKAQASSPTRMEQSDGKFQQATHTFQIFMEAANRYCSPVRYS